MGIIINGQNDTIGPVDNSMSLLGTVSIGGTMTIEDFTNIDSVGLVTARNGLHVTGGNVAVGHNNPGTNLDVLRTSNDTGGIIVRNTNNSQANARAQVEISGGDNADGRLKIECNGTEHTFRQDGNGNLQIHNASAERLRITSGGQVKISGEDDQDNFIVDAASGTEFAIHQDATDGEISIRAQDGTGNNYAKYMTFFTEGGSGPTERLRITSAGNVTATGTISDSKGGLRDIPLNDESTNASYTLVASDAGKVVHAHSTTATVVVPNSVFSVGNVVTILNGGTGNIAVNQGSGFALRNTADGSSGNRTLAQFGMATIYFTGSGVGYISGSNMT